MKRCSLGPPALLQAALAIAVWACPPGASGDPRIPIPGVAMPARARVPASLPTGAALDVTDPTATTWRRADAATEEKAYGWVESRASGWTPNLGQIGDTDGHAASNVLFAANVRSARVYVTTTGISQFFFSHVEEDVSKGPGEREAKEEPVEWARLDLELKGAAIRSDRARLEDPLADQGGANYYLPHCPNGVLNVPTYRKVTFPDVYPGIDWVVRSESGQGVHHDFVVHPGADVAQIRLEYAGATAIEVSDDRRSLRVRTALGEVREGALRCYQGDSSNPVAARFQVDGNTVSVLVDSYDRDIPLVIDPPLVWSTYYGGAGNDGPRSIYCDNVNNDVYIVGYSTSTDLPVLNAGGGSYY